MAVRKVSKNAGSSSIVRKVHIMENLQATKTVSGPGSKADTSDASTGSRLVAVTEKDGSTSSSAGTTATMQSASRKTWTSAELAVLRSKAGLVAGALADYQAAGGLVAVRNIEYEPGRFAVKVYLVAESLNIRAQKTPDGLDFELLPLGNDLVAEPSGSLVAEKA